MNNYDEKEKIQEFNGTNGQILMAWSRIEITRKGAKGFLNSGLAGTKIIFLRHLTAIQFKEAGKYTDGYIQFIFPGSTEDKNGFLSATRDENTVTFNKSQQQEFEKLREILVSRHDF